MSERVTLGNGGMVEVAVVILLEPGGVDKPMRSQELHPGAIPLKNPLCEPSSPWPFF